MNKGKISKKISGKNLISLVDFFRNKKEKTFIATGKAKLAILFLLIVFTGISTSPKTRFILAKSIESTANLLYKTVDKGDQDKWYEEHKLVSFFKNKYINLTKWYSCRNCDAAFFKDTPRNKAALGGLVPHQWPKE